MTSTVDMFLGNKSIDKDCFSYTGDGKSNMDKTNSLPQYSRDNQILTVERHFSETTTLSEALKQYILESREKTRLDAPENRLYNNPSNTTAVVSTKEDDSI